MAFLSRHLRLLCLLALFQVLGGPLVLCGVIAFSKAGGQGASQVSLQDRISLSLAQMQRAEQLATLSPSLFMEEGVSSGFWEGEELTQPNPSKPLPTGKVKDGKAKFHAIPLARVAAGLMAPEGVESSREKYRDRVPISRAQGPPLPPPRLS